MMIITSVKYFPPSLPGQFLRERREPGQPVSRELLSPCANPRVLARPGTSLWAARHGGWVRLL